MAYTVINFKTKEALKEALKSGEKVEVFQTDMFGRKIPDNGTVFLEGPHYPLPHTWYAEGEMKDGVLVKVK